MNSTAAFYYANCSLLASRTSFATYVQELNATTGFNETLLDACQSDICNALWGDGNADISGIGMVVGYFFESILGLLLAIGLSGSGAFSTRTPLTWQSNLVAKGCKTFFDCAIFFVASIQIACLIVLARKNSGISANGLGGLTVQITWAVALLCMLPLLYPMIILEFIERERSNYRFFLFCGCWILFFYTFVSQMVGDFGPSQIGTGAGPGGTTIITTEEMDVLISLCLSEVRPLSNTEQTILSAFGAAGSILICLYATLYLFWFMIQRQSRRQANWFRAKSKLIPPIYRSSTFYIWTVLVLVPILSVPQFWGLMRLRGIQRALANSTSNAYTDNQWTFGQVVAVMIFAPVFTEVGYLWIQERGPQITMQNPAGQNK